ncbi:P-loop containing nucleoside triphosphate hydrolase protein [Vararia minispora EC-137]|uniref:P-loop containing nucleoside triphosphate hydrolase protein n=1 Tax=Vararia minispora EC-137 TaxID=1314806 RepID=A0ACB8QP31_9AGAM|nr:P-loop containing nucleoside triphosphate hydrolase protein [Vararia minispora EC-137]
MHILAELKKDPGVPRLPDLKARQTEKSRLQTVRLVYFPCVVRASPPDERREDATMASEPTLSSLAQLASTSARTLEALGQDSDDSASGPAKTKEQLRRHYVRALHKVVEESDVVLLVLDARDPEGCRSRLVEEEVQRRESEGKKLVFILNKIDLVPRANAEAWLKHLRHTAPTLPFRSASAHQRTNLSSNSAPALLRLLKAYKPHAAQSIAVGVVGYPNVGKSSLINTLKRAKVCAVAAQPGHTKELQTVQLERGLKIVDSPGVIFDEPETGGPDRQIGVLLRNVVKVEDVEDPIGVVEQILTRTDKEKIMKIYNLPEFTSTLEFLTMQALSTGKLSKAYVLTAARVVLGDWNHQKIPFYTQPPSVHPSQLPSTVTVDGTTQVAPGAEATGSAQILGAYSAPFTLAGLFGEADAAMATDQDAVGAEGESSFVPDEGMQANMGIGMLVDADPESVSAGSKRRHSPEPDEIQSALAASGRAPKRLRKVAARAAAAPVLAVVTSRKAARTERKATAKRARRNAAMAAAEMDVE